MNKKVVLVSLVGLGSSCVGQNEVMVPQEEVRRTGEASLMRLRKQGSIPLIWQDEERKAQKNLDEGLHRGSLMTHSQENLSPRDVWKMLTPTTPKNVSLRKVRSSLDRTDAKINEFRDQSRLIKNPADRKGDKSFRS